MILEKRCNISLTPSAVENPEGGSKKEIAKGGSKKEKTKGGLKKKIISEGEIKNIKWKEFTLIMQRQHR